MQRWWMVVRWRLGAKHQRSGAGIGRNRPAAELLEDPEAQMPAVCPLEAQLSPEQWIAEICRQPERQDAKAHAADEWKHQQNIQL